MEKLISVLLMFANALLSLAQLPDYRCARAGINDRERTDCGYKGIGKSECIERNCCFSTAVYDSNHCYMPDPATPAPATTTPAASAASTTGNGTDSFVSSLTNFFGLSLLNTILVLSSAGVGLILLLAILCVAITRKKRKAKKKRRRSRSSSKGAAYDYDYGSQYDYDANAGENYYEEKETYY